MTFQVFGTNHLTEKGKMTTQNTEIEVQPQGAMGAFDGNDENLVRYLGLDPRKPADRAAVAVCRHYGFDPLLKHVVVIPSGGVYITRDGLLNVAHRSGQLDGIVVDQDPQMVDGEWIAKVSVYRKDMRHPFTFPGRYPSNGQNKNYGPEMALKAAEAHALRRAFDVAGLPTLDEQQPGENIAATPPAPVTADEITAPRQQRTRPSGTRKRGGEVKLSQEDLAEQNAKHEQMLADVAAAEPPVDAEIVDRSDEVAELFGAEADAEGGQ